MCVQYENAVQYDDLQAFVAADKRARRVACEETIQSMRDLKIGLEAPAPDATALAASADAAVGALRRWLSFVPASDIQRVEKLLNAVRAADTNPRDGKLSAAELSGMEESDQALWKKVQQLIG